MYYYLQTMTDITKLLNNSLEQASETKTKNIVELIKRNFDECLSTLSQSNLNKIKTSPIYFINLPRPGAGFKKIDENNYCAIYYNNDSNQSKIFFVNKEFNKAFHDEMNR
jgi:hypothetical protein